MGTELTDNAVIKLITGPGGTANTITVADLKQLIADTVQVKAYQNQSIGYLEPSAAWVNNQELNIKIVIEATSP